MLKRLISFLAQLWRSHFSLAVLFLFRCLKNKYIPILFDADRVHKMLTSAPIKTIAIVGAGFSGCLVAFHLLKTANRPLLIELIDRSHEIGLGVAYSTHDGYGGVAPLAPPSRQNLRRFSPGLVAADPSIDQTLPRLFDPRHRAQNDSG
jgi:hypothetical protein